MTGAPPKSAAAESRGGIGRLLDRLPLHAKLVASVVALVLVALAVIGLTAVGQLRTYLIDRTDGQLRSVSVRIAHQEFQDLAPQRFFNDVPLYIVFADARGRVVQPLAIDTRTTPRLPTVGLDRLPPNDFFTVPGPHGGPAWRALSFRSVLPQTGRLGVVTVAQSLREVDSTVGDLTRSELVVGGLLLVGAVGLGYLLVRRNLRALRQVEGTAEAIAAGDLSRRVPQHDPRTEVGRLTRSLNSMLGQIESAFQARQASESAARASEQQVRRFVTDASHELRTPLTSIRGFAELYRHGAVSNPTEVARTMRRIEDEATRMGRLVDDLVLLARLDQARPLQLRPVDLLPLAADAVHDARAVAPDRSIGLRTPGDEGPAPVVLGDADRLRQVLGNLMTNALTHTPAGTPVQLDLRVAGSQPNEVVLEISDRGPGMSAEDAARVFERFYRADAARSRSSGGAGLGLSIVAALVGAHGGSVGLRTAPGAGATFRITLPLLDPANGPPQPQPGGPVAVQPGSEVAL